MWCVLCYLPRARSIGGNVHEANSNDRFVLLVVRFASNKRSAVGLFFTIERLVDRLGDTYARRVFLRAQVHLAAFCGTPQRRGAVSLI